MFKLNLTDPAIDRAKATATLTEAGNLDITTQPGERVSIRPNPVDSTLENLVVINADGTEEILPVPGVNETVYSSSEEDQPV